MLESGAIELSKTNSTLYSDTYFSAKIQIIRKIIDCESKGINDMEL